jgi:hypothetical protein
VENFKESRLFYPEQVLSPYRSNAVANVSHWLSLFFYLIRFFAMQKCLINIECQQYYQTVATELNENMWFGNGA